MRPGPNEGNPVTVLIYCLDENPWKNAESKFRKQSWEVRQSKKHRDHKAKFQGKDLQRILKIEFYRSPSLSLFKGYSQYIHDRNYPRPGNNHLERLKYRGLLLKTRNSAPSYQLDEKDLKFSVHCMDWFENFFLHPEK